MSKAEFQVPPPPLIQQCMPISPNDTGHPDALAESMDSSWFCAFPWNQNPRHQQVLKVPPLPCIPRWPVQHPLNGPLSPGSLPRPPKISLLLVLAYSLFPMQKPARSLKCTSDSIILVLRSSNQSMYNIKMVTMGHVFQTRLIKEFADDQWPGRRFRATLVLLTALQEVSYKTGNKEWDGDLEETCIRIRNVW